MDIRQLTHLDALAKTASFTRAAESLNMAQPALSQSIKRLEQALGVTLVNRKSASNLHSREVSLTAEGKALHKHAGIIIKQLRLAEAEIKAMANLTRGEVRVGVSAMLGSFYLPTRLMAFRHQHPDLKLSLLESGIKDTLKALSKEEVDIAIIIAQDLTPDLDSYPLISAQMVVAMGVDHPLVEQESINLNDFFRHELVLFQPGYFHREWVLSAAQSLGIDPDIAFQTNLISLIKQVVSQGFAITNILDLALRDQSQYAIVSRPFDPPVFLDLHIAWKKKRPISQADRAFVEFLIDNR